MRRAIDLSRDELVRIVERLQQSLYLDTSGPKLVWDLDSEFNGADVCQDMAESLANVGLTCQREEPFIPLDLAPASDERPYYLHLDGSLFRQQRQLLEELRVAIVTQDFTRLSAVAEERVNGLISLGDAIADQAHDVHGIDCLLTDSEESP